MNAELYFQIPNEDVLDFAIKFCLAEQISFDVRKTDTHFRWNLYPCTDGEKLKTYLQFHDKKHYATTRY